MNAKAGGRSAEPGREREPGAAAFFRLVIVDVGVEDGFQSIRSEHLMIGTRSGIFKKK